MLLFLNSCILGFCFGTIYDFFRITRIAIKTCAVVIFIEDLLFFIVVTIGSFVFIVLENDGMLRGFLIIGILLGLILYFTTLSIVVTNAATAIIKVVKWILRFVYKLTLKPILWVFQIIGNSIQRFYFGRVFKKMVKVAENYSEKQQEQDIITDFLQK